MVEEKPLRERPTRKQPNDRPVPPRIEREKRVVELMIGIYCRGLHKPAARQSSSGLCPDCAELLAYAHARLDACRYGERKPSCRRCPTHCYRADMRKRIRLVMRYAGPRMLLRAPWAFLGHASRRC